MMRNKNGKIFFSSRLYDSKRAAFDIIGNIAHGEKQLISPYRVVCTGDNVCCNLVG